MRSLVHKCNDTLHYNCLMIFHSTKCYNCVILGNKNTVVLIWLNRVSGEFNYKLNTQQTIAIYSQADTIVL